MTRRNNILALMATGSLFAISTAAFSQEAPKPSSDDATVVVVTAQKREQKLQDVPMAITVAGAAQLERQQITTVRDLDRVSPAVTFVDGAPGGGAGIRGIATQSFTPSAEASVGIVVDGVPQGSVNVSNLFDMERVEVLRGPQGMLFGQSASAGVINMVTKAPKIGDTSGRLHIDYADHGTAGSEYGERVAQGVLNLPIDDHSAVRVSAFYNNTNGVERDNAIGGDNQNTDMGFRVRYLNNITDKLKFNLIADYDYQKYEGNHTFVFRKATSAAVVAALAVCGITASEDNNTGCSKYPSNETYTNAGLSAQFDYEMGDYTLTSITSYRMRDLGDHNTLDIVALQGDGVYPQLLQDQTGKLRQASQEIRVTSPAREKYDWVAGAYVSRSTYNNHGTKGLTIVPDPVATIQQLGDYSVATNTAAVFGQLNWNFTSQLTGLIGVRASQVTVSDSEVFTKILTLPFQPFPPFAPVTTNIDLLDPTGTSPGPHTAALSTTVNNMSGRVGLQYKASPDLMVYGTLSRGFKAPQINDTVFGNTPTVVRPEIPTSAELGAKGMIGKVGIDVNLFYTKVKDYQGQSCVFTPALTCGATNVPEVISKGVEVDLFGKPLPNLTLNGGFIYNPVTYPDQYTGSDGTEIGGTQMTGAPKYKFNLSGEYVVNFANDYQGFVAVDTTYKSLVHIYPSTDTNFDVAAHWITGAKIGVRFPDRMTTLALYARNIGNTPDPVNIYPGPSAGDYQQIIGKQGLRVVGISLDKSF
ncbi:TonB-dependent receptor [Asticcacaulis taihuensis]|uniref:TonB-dependent receptor n=1 Tax=Asticcacaulis taihuensis TaxID=260084 RepID=UPI0026F199DB|nr:TonB-dependent receptor [Asticcacaulis taihuensis]